MFVWMKIEVHLADAERETKTFFSLLPENAKPLRFIFMLYCETQAIKVTIIVLKS